MPQGLKKGFAVLGIESSCDETACALVEDGRRVLSNVIDSQIELHRLYGGVVPELAGRNHVMAIDRAAKRALADAGTDFSDVDAVAVTCGAGLVGCLLVGVSYAKALAYSLGVPLVAVNHIEAHMCANYLGTDAEPPYLCILASGGHTAVVHVAGYNEYSVLSSTVDDAIGEAFDKVARTLGLPYPGGPQIDRLSESGKPVYRLPSPLLKNGNLSYSGLKTAVVNLMHNAAQRNEALDAADLSASFSRAAIDPLLSVAEKHLKRLGLKTLALAGGVAANGYLRGEAQRLSQRTGIRVLLPEKKLCTDNGAMVASQGYFLLAEKGVNCDLTLNAAPTLRLRGDKPSRR